jgi:hypothetical protein
MSDTFISFIVEQYIKGKQTSTLVKVFIILRKSLTIKASQRRLNCERALLRTHGL